VKFILRKINRLIHRATAPKSALPWRTRLEVKRLRELPRYVETTTRLLGPLVTIPDGPSFVSAWKDVFLHHIYKFPTKSHTPRILDCGANIGLACVFFKTFFPRARITAFEPDPKIFRYLQSTLKSVHLLDIELVPKAV
jgi:hypothetical protein